MLVRTRWKKYISKFLLGDVKDKYIITSYMVEKLYAIFIWWKNVM